MRQFILLPRKFLVFFLAGFLLFSGPAVTTGQSIQDQIKKKNEEIRKLEEEETRFRADLQDVEREVNTLSSRVRTLENEINRLDVSIKVTNTRISRTDLEVQELSADIEAKERKIRENRVRLGALLLAVAERDHETPLEIMMKNRSLSAFFTSLDNIMSVGDELKVTVDGLRQNREELKAEKLNAELKHVELAGLAETLVDQKSLQEGERQERSALLRETRNQEQRYQQLISDNQKKRASLQNEINSLEASLKADFDRTLLPKSGTGVLGWPLPEPVLVTQQFGNTTFALSGAYNGKGHNGIDFRATVGTPIFSSESGVVRQVGNTDVGCAGASYGKWILIDHTNNLSTLYAHLSLAKVNPGQSVKRGELIAYSGRTGYATGPHLHYTVYASEAVSVGTLKSRVCGRNMVLPLSPFGGYLNPMNYL